MSDEKSLALRDVVTLAETAVQSRLFGQASKDQLVTLMALCQAEGLHPMTALRRYHIIQGRPAMRSDAMLAEFQRQGGKVAWLERTHDAVEAEFSAPGLVGSVKVRWSMDDAKRAGVVGKDNWRSYPRQMLTARVISEGIRVAMPGVVSGIYAPEEVMDFDPNASSYSPPSRRDLHVVQEQVSVESREPGSDDDAELGPPSPLDEMDDPADQVPIYEDGDLIRTEPRLTKAQFRRLKMLQRTLGDRVSIQVDGKGYRGEEAWHRILLRDYGKTTSKDLSVREAEKLIDKLQERVDKLNANLRRANESIDEGLPATMGGVK